MAALSGVDSMKNFKASFCRYIGTVYIPKHLRELDEDIILHVSDTTTNFFPDMKKLLKVLKPKYIVHTGDLVDNIKLQFVKASAARYEMRVRTLIEMMEGSSAKEIYISVGNHDSYPIIKKIAKRSTIIKDINCIDIEGMDIVISHFPKKIIDYEGDCRYFLFGHSLDLHTQKIDEKIYLNGISSINIITLKSKKIYKLPYPYVVDDWRQRRGKLGL
ncbi:Calcineurin-like phosphoesterase [Peptoclostridium litorale DSM 5388]|uniref:Calcineurin-like phosphoesterase domain-containing protein n=2 Tax=Peptoclostridium litorale TaxID=1557 RepID=A0A069RF71_PEPLI|nr:hypothetical protein CLIT_10c04010 [Peptoclostridium litorale DSM 5388]SIO00807.1 Calcineurin-like phosphoesterase [Peptoclostridium litorale DSM 5388]